MAREAMDVCLRVLKEGNKSQNCDSCSVRKRLLIVSHITFHMQIFSDNLSQNSCIPWE